MNILTLEQQLDRVAEYSQNPVKRVGTGFPQIDEVCGGPAPGEVFTIIGRSFTGKSIVAQNIINNNRTVPSVFFSLEMPYSQALIRLYSMWSSTPSWKVQKLIERGGLPDDLYGLADAFPYHVIADRSSLDVGSMSKVYESYRSLFGFSPEFAVVDYLELVAGAKISAEGYQATESQITQLKDWAKSENTRVFVVHQCNKSKPVWEAPDEDSPRGGGYTESDFMMGLWRPHRDPEASTADRLYEKDKLHVNLIKNRAYFDLLDEAVYVFRPSLKIEEEGIYERSNQQVGEVPQIEQGPNPWTA